VQQFFISVNTHVTDADNNCWAKIYMKGPPKT